MKINFGQINLRFENIDGNNERLKSISDLIWKMLDEKLQAYNNNSSTAAEMIFRKIKLDEIVIPPIRVNSDRSNYEIASRCASAIYQAVMMKLR